MSSEEEKLYARAEMLEETDELAQAVTGILTGAQGVGVDPRAVISLTAALQILDPGASATYRAGSKKDRRADSGYGSDGEFLEALSDAEDQVPSATAIAAARGMWQPSHGSLSGWSGR